MARQVFVSKYGIYKSHNTSARFPANLEGQDYK